MELLNKINAAIVNPIIGLMIAIGVIVFLFGVVEFIAGSASDEKRSTGKRHIIWGIIGLFIAISVLGLMNLLANFWSGIK
ncbi:MAG: hypothetical protein NTX55_00815 [Candidatus Parcubacteria bacterium]|nr:hypothetical protein [Candidatus Parcubacteria bacterium]